MRMLRVICLATLFYSISSKVIDDIKVDIKNNINIVSDTLEATNKYLNDLKTLEEITKSLIEDERFKLINITYIWDYFLIHTIMGIDNEIEETQHVTPRKEAKYTRETRDVEDEKNVDNWAANFYKYITSHINILDVGKRLFNCFTTEMIGDYKKESNTDENVCEITLNMEAIPPPLELINLLPWCPCTYPNKHIYTKIKDQNDSERWWQKVVNPHIQKRKNKIDSVYCSKIELENNTTMVSQYCCYDENYILITQGLNAGSIHYIAQDVMKQMRKIFNLYPTVQCNFLKLIKSLPPNNGYKCVENPKFLKYV